MAASCIYVYIRVCSIVVLYVNHVVYHMAYGQAYISLIAYDCNNEIKSLCLTSIIQCLEVVAHCLGLIAQETFLCQSDSSMSNAVQVSFRARSLLI